MSAPKAKSLVFIILSSQLIGDSSSAVLNQIKPESLELVQQIKADLRKNNDDYAELKSNNTTKDVATTSDAPPSSLDVWTEGSLNARRIMIGDKIRRRMYGLEQPEQTDLKLTPIMKTTLDGILRYRSFTKHHNVKPKKYLRKDKMKKFIERNRGRLRKFRVKKRSKKSGKGPALRQAVGQAMELAVGQVVKDGTEVPTDTQLDQAPAHGARVQMLRLKGRLCHRSVLVPEGPKYDSKGNVYLAAHGAGAARSRQYGRTRVPSLLLPRCCNCCKKSVLGCE